MVTTKSEETTARDRGLPAQCTICVTTSAGDAGAGPVVTEARGEGARGSFVWPTVETHTVR
jgi:hypothetical protein